MASDIKKPRSAMANILDGNLLAGTLADADVGVAKRARSITRPSTELSPNKAATTTQQLAALDPNVCIPWNYSDRQDNEFGDLKALANSMAQHGQQEPVLVRPTERNGHQYEVIFGNRRWRAAKLANLKLQAIVKPMDDQTAALSQKEENENRQDLSDYSRALNYQKLLAESIFISEAQMSDFFKINRQTMNDIMAYVRVPLKLRNAIPNYHSLSRVTVVKLAKLAKQSSNISKLMALAAKIGEKKITAANIEQFLTKKADNKTDDQVASAAIYDSNGKPFAELKHRTHGNCVITINKNAMTKLEMSQLITVFEELSDSTLDN